jgi:hypothetical protein
LPVGGFAPAQQRFNQNRCGPPPPHHRVGLELPVERRTRHRDGAVDVAGSGLLVRDLHFGE